MEEENNSTGKSISWKGLREAFLYGVGVLIIFGLTELFGRAMLIPLAALIIGYVIYSKIKKKEQ